MRREILSTALKRIGQKKRPRRGGGGGAFEGLNQRGGNWKKKGPPAAFPENATAHQTTSRLPSKGENVKRKGTKVCLEHSVARKSLRMLENRKTKKKIEIGGKEKEKSEQTDAEKDKIQAIREN